MMNPMQLMQTVQGMVRGGNPQAMVQQIMQKNPQFAQMLQGQNPQAMATQMMQKMGMSQQDIQQFVRQLQNGGGMPGGMPGGMMSRR